MKILLDTHVILWIAENSPKLSEELRNIISEKNNIKCVSIVSAWEIAIKLGREDFSFDGGINEFFRIIKHNKFRMLPIRGEYLRHIPDLPKIHKDPFDRMLIATALTEDMTLMTVDENIHKYDVKWVW